MKYVRRFAGYTLLIGVILLLIDKCFFFAPISYKEEIYRIDSIKNININNSVGEIEIEKGSQNIIKAEGNHNVKIVDGNIDINSSGVVNRNEIKQNIYIQYNGDDFNLNVENFAGTLELELPKKSNIVLKNIVGDINVETPDKTINFISDNALASKQFENVTNTKNSSNNLSIINFVGEIEFY